MQLSHRFVFLGNLVSSDVELPLASVYVALQQHGAHAEDLLHHRVLSQVVLTLFTQRGQKPARHENHSKNLIRNLI